MNYFHLIANNVTEFIHLHLVGRHFTPYLPSLTHTNLQNENIHALENLNEQVSDPGSLRTSSRTSNIHNENGNETERNTNLLNANNGNIDALNETNKCYPDSPSEPGGQHTTSHSNASRTSEPFDNQMDVTENHIQNQSNRPGSNRPNAVLEEPQQPTDQENGQSARAGGALRRYLVVGARPPREKPPWALQEGEEPPPFAKLTVISEHPFTYRENILYLVSADGFLDTEILEAFLERGYLNEDELTSREFVIGEVNISQIRDIDMIGVYVKNHIDDRPLRSDIKKCLRTLKATMRAKDIKAIAIARDLAILSLSEWAYFIEQFERIFAGTPLIAVLYNNNLPVPPVKDRYKLMREYHEAAMGGHRGINKTYSKIAKDYYWRNMRPDIKQFVLRCATCQSNKLVRVKTKLPLLISNTPALPFEQLSLDFYGPLEETEEGFKYILSAQDALTKYIILTPVKRANAEEVARALTEKIICYFGPPASILTDQGTHFRNKLLDEFAKIFKIQKYCTTAYHPQSNGAIERMHHTLTEYLRKYKENKQDWCNWTAICQNAYNCTEHESTGFSPHELLFGTKARTPPSFPSRDHFPTYNEYVRDMIFHLTQLQTIAAMNQVQAKYRSKYYFDRKLNTAKAK